MSGFFKEKQSVYFIYDKALFNTKDKAEKTKELYDLDISDLYTLLYRVKNNKDKLVFENAINYILNGTLSHHNAIQYIIINSSLF